MLNFVKILKVYYTLLPSYDGVQLYTEWMEKFCIKNDDH